jgi:hypothetical protein
MWAIVAIAVLSMSSVAFAQRGRGGPGGGGGLFGGGQTNGLDLLGDENVRKELDLVDDQIAKLQEVGGKMRDEMRAAFEGFDFQGLRDLSEEERNAKFAKRWSKFRPTFRRTLIRFSCRSSVSA